MSISVKQIVSLENSQILIDFNSFQEAA